MFEIFAHGNPFEKKIEEQKAIDKKIDPNGEAMFNFIMVMLVILVGMFMFIIAQMALYGYSMH